MEGDEVIQRQIRQEFQELCTIARGRARHRETRGRQNSRRGNARENRISEIDRQKKFQLQFTIGGRTYTTVLEAQCETITVGALSAKQFSVRTKSLQKARPCIEIVIAIPPHGVSLQKYIEKELHEFDSMISANSPENQCFTPVLVSNRTNPNESLRVTSADVLQILKTKLQYLFPNPYGLLITIQDAATTKYVALTPFRILRGLTPFYFKYGYLYRNLQPIEMILPSVSWGSLRSKPYFGALTYGERIYQITNKHYRDMISISDVLEDIPFELESTKNEEFILEHRPDSRKVLYNDLMLSLSLLKTIARERGYSELQLSPLGGEGNIFIAIHEPSTPEWDMSYNRLLFTDFRPISEGGNRKNRQQNKTRKNILLK